MKEWASKLKTMRLVELRSLWMRLARWTPNRFSYLEWISSIG